MKYNDFDDYKYYGNPKKKPCCKPCEDPCKDPCDKDDKPWDDKCDKPWDKDCDKDKKPWDKDSDKHDKKHDKDKKENSCCNCDMRDALKLLFDPSVKNDVRFNRFAFVGSHFVVGAFIQEGPNPGTDNLDLDNADNPARLVSVDNCNCDLIKIQSNGVYYPIPTNNSNEARNRVDIAIAYASLCDLDAIAFDVNNPTDFIRDFVKLLDKKHPCNDRKCNECECKCNKGILKNLFNPFSSNGRVNLTAGSLTLRNVAVLGILGNILILNDGPRVYFVCINSIGFFGPAL